jgi:signal transduction histidine kinase/CheY-like chemotaxis protein
MRDFVHDAIKQGAKTGEMPPPEELLLMRQDGSRVPVFSSHTVLNLGEKEPEFYCLDVDITVQKKLRERLQQTQKMEAISTLSGGIAHQFNNALSVITGNIDLLEIDFPSDENVANYLKDMKASAILMTKLTAQLLAYARGGKYQDKTVSLSDFVRETVPLVKHAIDSAIDVETDLPSNILNVKADLTQMQMVMSAVLTNAAEAMEGKGRIRVTCRDTIITEETVGDFPGLTPGKYVNLTIVDDGKGMDEETRNRIFEPFFTTKLEGRGLGMAAAHGIIKNHAGWISVDSELGKGTTVKIYLPAIESVQTRPTGLPVAETPVKEDPKPKTKLIKGTGTILVIEDEEPVMKISRAILERMGYRVLEARTGQEAVDIVKTFEGHIDLALLDILLPDMTGNDIYPLIMETRPDLKVIVFSGYSIDGPAREILNAGAEDFIQKPFTMAGLSEKLKKILGGGQ